MKKPAVTTKRSVTFDFLFEGASILTRLIEKLWIKDPNNRESYGQVAGGVGIFCNLLLGLLKFLAGLFFASVSVMADGLNNLTDAASSVVTLIAFKLAAAPADQEHPFGHQRIEYFSGVIVSVLILLVGFELGKESVSRILHPAETEIGLLMVIFLVLSILVKFWMYLFNRAFSQKIGSLSLQAVAKDCINDVISTGAVLLCAAISYFSGFDLDGYAGLAVAIFIFVGGIKMLKDTADPLLGVAADPEKARKIKEKVLSFDGVLGVHDLMIHDYGPTKCFASVHVEMDRNNDVMYSHDITDQIERAFSKEGIHLVVHLDPIVSGDAEVDALKAMVRNVVRTIHASMDIHDFRAVVGVLHTNLIFDVSVPFSVELNDTDLAELITAAIKAVDDCYYPVIHIDRGMS